MRLIDADLLLERIYEYQSKAIETEDIIHSVKTLPTAYDVENVVEQIKREQYDITECSYERGFNAMARFAQKVVRKGGVE